MLAPTPDVVRILVADDNPLNRQVLELMLRRLGLARARRELGPR